MKLHLRNKCICCNGKKLLEIINLGNHSFADRFVPKNKIKDKDPEYPLILDLCNKCKFIQSRIITDPKDRYINYDYSYTSSNSKYSRNHWKNFAFYLRKKRKIKNSKIIEIGSNDGYLLKHLKKMKANVLGIDASKFMVKISKENKIDTLHAIFNFNQSKKIKKKFGYSNIIIANNVFNHSDNPKNFLKGVYHLLEKNGMFVFEQPYFARGLFAEKFDQIYHEHVSYFTAKNIHSILDVCNFKILSMEENEYHGGSMRTIAVKKNSLLSEIDISKKIQFENRNNIYKKNFYSKMFKKINKRKNTLKKKLYSLKKKNYVIAGIGAGAKANTFLTYFNLDFNIINFITDTSKYKQFKFTPLTRVIIKSDNELKKYNKIACIILSWNISSILIKKLKIINKKIYFIKI